MILKGGEKEKSPLAVFVFQGLIIAIICIRMVVMMLGRWMECDIWFILSLGRYIVQNGIPHTNPFFIGREIGTIVPQWLYDVLMYKIQNHFGYGALLIIPYSCVVIGSLFLYKIAQKYHVDKYMSILLIASYWYINVGTFTLRPNIFSAMLCIVQIYLLEEYSQCSSIKWLVPVPLISVLEINMHCAIWPMHLCILAAYIAPQIRIPLCVKKHSYKIKPLVYVFFITLLAGLVNPYGIDAMLFLHGAITPDTVVLIKEMQPATLNYGETMGMLVCAGVIIHAITYKYISYQHFYLFLGWLFLGTQYSRNYIWAFLGILIVTFTLLRDTDFTKRYRIITPQNWLGFWPFIPFLVISLLSRPRVISPDENNINTPKDVVEYIQTYTPERNRILNEFDNGGYFEWNGFKTYLDTRADAFLPKYTGGYDFFHEYLQMAYYADLNQIHEIVENYDFDYAYVSDSTKLYLYFVNSSDYEYILSVREKYDTEGYPVPLDEAEKGVLFRRIKFSD